MVTMRDEEARRVESVMMMVLRPGGLPGFDEAF
jgi:hypothetical protein